MGAMLCTLYLLLFQTKENYFIHFLERKGRTKKNYFNLGHYEQFFYGCEMYYDEAITFVNLIIIIIPPPFCRRQGVFFINRLSLPHSHTKKAESNHFVNNFTFPKKNPIIIIECEKKLSLSLIPKWYLEQGGYYTIDESENSLNLPQLSTKREHIFRRIKKLLRTHMMMKERGEVPPMLLKWLPLENDFLKVNKQGRKLEH